MYSHLGSGSGDTPIDLTSPNLSTQTIGWTSVAWYSGGKLGLKTSLGDAHFNGLSAVQKQNNTGVPSSTGSFFYYLHYTEQHGKITTYHYYEIDANQSVSSAMFDSMGFIISNDYGSGGSEMSLSSILNSSVADLLSSEAVLALDGSEGGDTLNLKDVGGMLTGDGGDDTLVGSNQNDTLVGGIGNDYLLGRGGDDDLIAYESSGSPAGNDTLKGGAGDDNIFLSLVEKNQAYVVDGGSGFNKINMGGDITSTSFKNLQSANLEFDLIYNAGQLNQFSTIRAGGKTLTQSDDGKSILRIESGASASLILLGSGKSETDLSSANAGWNVTAELGSNLLKLGSGDDIVSTGDGKDTIYGGDGNDNISAGGQDDTLYGETGDDVLDGGSGSDKLAGGTGNDTLIGGTGNDTFVLNDGKKVTIFGDKFSKALDFQTKKQGGHDVLQLTGSSDDYKIIVADPTSNTLTTKIFRTSDNASYTLQGVEKVSFTEAAKNDTPLLNGNWVSETAFQMVNVYDDSSPWWSGRWHASEAIELDMDPADKNYTVSGGIFTNVGGPVGFNYDAVAAVAVGIVGGTRTLSISFKGTDEKPTGELFSADLGYNLKEYFDLYRPLIDAIENYVSNGANGIKKVVVNGHSLGGAMAQYLVAELAASTRVYGYTYGSIGTLKTVNNSANYHQTNFVHVGDIADWLLNSHSGIREGGTVWLNSPVVGTSVPGLKQLRLHSQELYESNVDLLMEYATGKIASSFSSTDLAKKLVGTGWTSGSIQVAIGGARADSFSLTSDDFYVIGDAGDDRFDLWAFNVDAQSVTDTVAGARGRVINGGAGDDDTAYLALGISNYVRTTTKDGSLKITRISDDKVIATIEKSVEHIMWGSDLRNFDGSKVAAKSYSGTKDVTLGDGGQYAKIGAGGGKVTGGNGDDTIVASTGSKTILGGAGNDYLRAGDGEHSAKSAATSKVDTVMIDGGKGIDTMIGGVGNQTYVVDNIGDMIADLGGHDTVKSSVGYTLGDGLEELILTGKALSGQGNGGKNLLEGNSGKNTLEGLAGNDTLIGGDGDDTLQGGKGVDKLHGGSDSDTFVFATGDSGKTRAQADTISDFTAADRIDLTGWDANSKKSGFQTLEFIGTHAFSGHAGELRFVKGSSDTWIEGDTNGDKKVDFVIHLDDAVTMKAGYFHF